MSLDDSRDETERNIETALAAMIAAGEIELAGMDERGRAVYRRVTPLAAHCDECGNDVPTTEAFTDGPWTMNVCPDCAPAYRE